MNVAFINPESSHVSATPARANCRPVVAAGQARRWDGSFQHSRVTAMSDRTPSRFCLDAITDNVVDLDALRIERRRIPVSGPTEDDIKTARKALVTCHALYTSAVKETVAPLVYHCASARYRNRLNDRLVSLLADLSVLHDDLLGEVGEHLIERE